MAISGMSAELTLSVTLEWFRLVSFEKDSDRLIRKLIPVTDFCFHVKTGDDGTGFFDLLSFVMRWLDLMGISAIPLSCRLTLGMGE
ncbi:hypothetical protein [Candidatus Nitrospira salsa]